MGYHIIINLQIFLFLLDCYLIWEYVGRRKQKIFLGVIPENELHIKTFRTNNKTKALTIYTETVFFKA